MRRWLFVIGLAVAMAAPGCKGKGTGQKPSDSKTIIAEQPSETEIEPGPGGRKVKRQAEQIGQTVKKQIASNTSWDKGSADKYATAVEEALVEWVQSKSGLNKDQQKQLTDTFPEFSRYSLSPTIREDSLPYYIDAAEYAVKMYAARTPVNKATQEKIDGQIDAFCDTLQPALVQYFSQRSSKETLTKTVVEIRKVLKDCTRNPWFPALKEPLDSKEENEVRDQVAQTLMSQLNDFTKKEAEGRTLNFDWGVSSAWSSATKFVSKSIKPPTDRMLMFTHAPAGPILGFQIRPPMMKPSPAGGAPRPGGAPTPGGVPTPGGPAPTTPPPPPAPPG